MTQLPTDAAARKARPVMTGCFDYFADALQHLAEYVPCDAELSDPTPAGWVLDGIHAHHRIFEASDLENAATAAIQALRMLQDELTGMSPGATGFPAPNDTGCLLSLFDTFGAALCEVSALSVIGNNQHNPGEPLHWARGKSMDQRDTAARHLLERGTIDATDGVRHSTKTAWRTLAQLQCTLEQVNGWDMPRGCRAL